MSKGIPGISNVVKTVEKLKEVVEQLLGQRGNELDKAVTLRELVDAGLAKYRKSDGSYIQARSLTGRLVSLKEGANYTEPLKAVSNLTAVGSLGMIHLQWDGINYPYLLRYNIYRADVNDFGQSIKISATVSNVFADELGNGTGANGKYYWIRAESIAGVEGPLSSTAGVYGETSYDPSYVLSLLTKKWELSKDYTIDDVVIPNPSNETGLWYKVTTDSGSSGIVEPIWPDTIGQTVVDNGITWTAIAAPTELVPFIVGEVDGSPAVIMNTVYIGDATIDTAKIKTLIADKITAGNLTASIDITTGAIKGGQSAYNTGTGYYLGKSGSDYVFSIGTSGGDGITWDGTNLNITGAVTITGGSVDYANVTGTKPPANATVNNVFSQDAEPVSGMVESDIWFDTNDGNKLYRYEAGLWVLRRDAGISQALIDASNAQSTADGRIQSFYQDSAPISGMSEGDIWFDTNDGNKIYIYESSLWVARQDSGITQAINNASTAQATADGKVTTFFTVSTPTAEGLGDLWYNSSNKLLKRWTGSTWDTISNAFTESDLNALNLINAPAQAGADVTGSNTAANISGQGSLATKNSVDLSSGEVTNKSADYISETAAKKWAAETGADKTQTKIDGGIITTGYINLSTAGYIRSGKPTYASTTTGWWIGNDAGTPKINIGGTNYHFKWTGTGLDIKGAVVVSASSGKRIEINPNNDNEIHFYGDRGDTTIEEIATIGIKTEGSDYVIGKFGNLDCSRIAIRAHSKDSIAVDAYSVTSYAVYATTSTGQGVYAYSNYGDGVEGYSNRRYGGVFDCSNSLGFGNLYLPASYTSGVPTAAAPTGTIRMSANGKLYLRTGGVWKEFLVS